LARPLDRRAEPRWTAPPAGPGVAARSAPELPARAPGPGQADVADRAGRELGALGGRGRPRGDRGGSAAPPPPPCRSPAPRPGLQTAPRVRRDRRDRELHHYV